MGHKRKAVKQNWEVHPGKYRDGKTDEEVSNVPTNSNDLTELFVKSDLEYRSDCADEDSDSIPDYNLVSACATNSASAMRVVRIVLLQFGGVGRDRCKAKHGPSQCRDRWGSEHVCLWERS